MSDAVCRIAVAFIRTMLLVTAIIGIVQYVEKTPREARRLSGILFPIALIIGRDGIRWEGKL